MYPSKRKNSKIYCLEMTSNHRKFNSYKIYNILCDSVKLFLWDIYLFSQNSFKEELTRTNNIVIY